MNTAEIIIRLKDQNIEALERIRKNTDELDKSLSTLGNNNGLDSIKNKTVDLQGSLNELISTGAKLAASFAAISAFTDLAKDAENAEKRISILSDSLQKLGYDPASSVSKLKDLATELGVSFSVVAENTSQLLRAGYTLEQITELYKRASASAILAGADTKTGIDNITNALITQQSIYLNQVGIAENLSTAFNNYAKELKKSSDELTDAERRQAAYNLVVSATAKEYEYLPQLLSGITGQQAQLNTKLEQFKQQIGEALIPTISSLLSGLNNALSLLNSMPQPLRDAATSAALAATAISSLSAAVGALRIALTALSGTGGLILLFGSALVGLASYLNSSAETTDKLKNAFNDTKKSLSELYGTLGNSKDIDTYLKNLDEIIARETDQKRKEALEKHKELILSQKDAYKDVKVAVDELAKAELKRMLDSLELQKKALEIQLKNKLATSGFTVNEASDFVNTAYSYGASAVTSKAEAERKAYIDKFKENANLNTIQKYDTLISLGSAFDRLYEIQKEEREVSSMLSTSREERASTFTPSRSTTTSTSSSSSSNKKDDKEAKKKLEEKLKRKADLIDKLNNLYSSVLNVSTLDDYLKARADFENLQKESSEFSSDAKVASLLKNIDRALFFLKDSDMFLDESTTTEDSFIDPKTRKVTRQTIRIPKSSIPTIEPSSSVPSSDTITDIKDNSKEIIEAYKKDTEFVIDSSQAFVDAYKLLDEIKQAYADNDLLDFNEKLDYLNTAIKGLKEIGADTSVLEDARDSFLNSIPKLQDSAVSQKEIVDAYKKDTEFVINNAEVFQEAYKVLDELKQAWNADDLSTFNERQDYLYSLIKGLKEQGADTSSLESTLNSFLDSIPKLQDSIVNVDEIVKKYNEETSFNIDIGSAIADYLSLLKEIEQLVKDENIDTARQKIEEASATLQGLKELGVDTTKLANYFDYIKRNLSAKLKEQLRNKNTANITETDTDIVLSVALDIKEDKNFTEFTYLLDFINKLLEDTSNLTEKEVQQLEQAKKTLLEKKNAYLELKNAAEEQANALYEEVTVSKEQQSKYEETAKKLQELANKYPELTDKVKEYLAVLNKLDEQEKVIKRFTELKDKVLELKNTFNELVNLLGLAGSIEVEGINNLFDGVAKGLEGAAKLAANDILGAVTSFASAIAGVIDGLNKLVIGNNLKVADDIRKQAESIEKNAYKTYQLPEGVKKAIADAKNEAAKVDNFWLNLFDKGAVEAAKKRAAEYKEFLENFDKAAQSIYSSVSSALLSAFKEFAKGNISLDQLKENISSSIKDAVGTAFLQALIQNELLKGALGKLLAEISEAIAKGDVEKAKQLSKQAKEQADKFTQTVIDSGVLDIFDNAKKVNEETKDLVYSSTSLGTFIADTISVPLYDASKVFENSVYVFKAAVDKFANTTLNIKVDTVNDAVKAVVMPAY